MPDKSRITPRLDTPEPGQSHATVPDDLPALCEGVINDEPGALDRLHARLTPGLIRHFARKLGDRADAADELTQQTWIAFWQALTRGKYDPAKGRPSTFLYAVSANIWLRHLRAVGRARPEQRLDDRFQGATGRSGGSGVGSSNAASSGGAGQGLVGVDAVDDPAGLSIEAAAIDLVRRVLRAEEPGTGLSEEERTILRAISQGRTDRELAAELNVAPSTAHARKRIATEKLRVFLRSRGHAESPESSDAERTGSE